MGSPRIKGITKTGIFVWDDSTATYKAWDGAVTQSGVWDINDISGTISLPTGASTSAKQLPDNHNVTANAGTNLNTSALALDATLTDKSQITQLADASGNIISSSVTESGTYHLGTSVEQNVVDDSNNSSTSNLASGATFTGTGTTTLGVVGLQWSLKTDQNCTVYIEESPDNTNWDISYAFDYIALKGGRGETVQASQAYWRIRVTNEGMSTTSYLRLQGVLCPIATPLPSELSPDGRLKNEGTLTGQQNTERHVWVSPTNTLGTNSTVRLVGTNFDGTTKDPNFWTETVANGGAVAQTGEIKLTTSIAANGSAKYASAQQARFVVGSALQFVGAYKFNDALVTDNVRRCGAYDADEGFFFQLDGSTFSVGSRKTTTDTLVNSGDFNGNYGSVFVINPALYYKLDIEWTPLGAFYYVNGILLHKSLGGHLTRRLTLPITFENVNEGSTTDVTFDCLGVVIIREGELFTNPTSKLVTGESETVLKYGAGTLKGCVISAIVNGADVNFYDGTSTAGTLIWASGNQGARTEPLNIDFFGLPFSTGLTLEIADSSAAVLSVYE